MPSGGTGEEEFSLLPESKHSGSVSSPGHARPPFTKREVNAGELLPLFNEEESHDDQET
ncbi:UNVERIFIED_ORG: hypothetical protein GGD48_004563 [Rhizobium etli]|jgi:hypothetical protein